MSSFCCLVNQKRERFTVTPRKGQLYSIFKGLNLTAHGWGKFIKNIKEAILLWPSGASLCGKRHREKHLTATEMKHQHCWIFPSQGLLLQL